MTRATAILLSAGTAIFVALLVWQGAESVASTLMVAGWWLLVVAAFHLLPLAIDAGAIVVLLDRNSVKHSLRQALLARWVGEAVNSLLPAGQIGGPLLMVRYLARHGVRMRDAVASITVSTTMQALAQVLFALAGVATFGIHASRETPVDWRLPALVATAALSFLVFAFYWAQRRGLFGRLLRIASSRLAGRDWSVLTAHADALDAAVSALYGERRKLAATFLLSFVGWLVGIGEVLLALHFLEHPVDWLDALLLESVGQAIRGAAFAIPGSLGVQEGGYLLLAPLVGLPPDVALALSLAKRARELALGVPGLVYLHWSERTWLGRRGAQVPMAD